MKQLPGRAAQFCFEGFVAKGSHYGGAFEGAFLHVDGVDRGGAVVWGTGGRGVRREEQDEGEGDESEGGEEED